MVAPMFANLLLVSSQAPFSSPYLWLSTNRTFQLSDDKSFSKLQVGYIGSWLGLNKAMEEAVAYTIMNHASAFNAACNFWCFMPRSETLKFAFKNAIKLRGLPDTVEAWNLLVK